MVRRALIGTDVQLPSGIIGRCTGIDDTTEYARVVTRDGAHRDVPQYDLVQVRSCGHCGGRYPAGQSCGCFDNGGQ